MSRRPSQAAERAYCSWRLVPAPKRAEMLFAAAQLIAERKEAFARDMTREMGKVLDETRGDVQEAIDMTYFMAGEGRRQYGQTVPSELRDKFAMSVRQPLGVCSIITPWNFPMAIPSWKIIPALVCGNTVVFKPATLTPLSAVNFVKVLEEAGIPPGVVNLVTGGPDVGELMTTHDAVKVVSFTGSTAVGRIVNQHAAPTFKKVASRDGRQERHHDHGRRAPRARGRRLPVGRLRHDRAALHGGEPRRRAREGLRRVRRRQFVARARALRVGDGLDERTQMGPSVSESQLETVMKYVRDRQERRRATRHGRQPADVRGALARAGSTSRRSSPTSSPTMRIAQEEIFGPVVSVMRCRSLDEAIEIGNGVAYGLSASIYTQDINRAFTAMRDMYTGIFYVNAPTIGAEVHLPFGGTKATGNGHREAGTAALDVFSEWKSIYVDFSGKLQRAQIDT